MSTPILRGSFRALWRKEPLVTVELYVDRIQLRLISPSVSLDQISLNDVYGCHRMKGRAESDYSAYFSLYVYAISILKGKQLSRLRKVFTFQINEASVGGRRSLSDSPIEGPGCSPQTINNLYQQNVSLCNTWVNEILRLTKAASTSIERLSEYMQTGRPLQRRLCVIVNPYSGPGKALQVFQEKVMPVFAEAGVLCKLVITEQANHAKDFVQKLILTDWDGIVIVSGDGLVYEVINGLMERSDRIEALKLPIGVVPGGSGNALIASILYACNEPFNRNDFAQQSALICARPRCIPVRLIHLETLGEHIASFMSVGWGLLADIDIESERFRRTLGSARFTAGAVFRVARLKTYRGRVSFVPVGDKWKHFSTIASGQQEKLARSLSENNTTAASVMRRNSAVNGVNMRPTGGVHSSKSTNQLSLYHPQDSRKSSTWTTTPVEEQPSTPMDTERFYLQIEFEGSQDDLDEKGSEAVRKLNGHANRQKSGDGLGEAMRFHDAMPMPPLDKPLPIDGEWVTLEENFVLIYVAYLSHLSADILYLPEAKLDEDQIYLTLIKAGAPRSQLAKFLMAMQTGEHLDNPYFEVIPVKAVRIEPLTNAGVLTVDGELIKDFGPIQLCVSSLKATVMCRHDAVVSEELDESTRL